MARKTVDFNKSGIGKLPNDKPVAAAADVYVRCFPTVKPNIHSAREHFLSHLRTWSQSYLPKIQ